MTNRGVPRLATPQRHQRSDAAQNREAILAAALAALSESADASLNSIAKRAGVANATLYRHFPTRGRPVGDRAELGLARPRRPAL